MKAKTTSAHSALAAASATTFIDETGEDRRWLQAALAFAVMLHVVAFAVNWPALSGSESATRAESGRTLYVLRNVLFKRQPVTAQLPTPPRRVVPIPDATPSGPEVILPAEPPATDVPDLGDQVLGAIKIPEAPPEHRVVQAYADIAPPVVLHRVTPVYTDLARKVGYQGVAIVELLIDEHGEVARARVLRELPFGLSDSALAAVRQWRFGPSTLNGQPVSVVYRIAVQFRLQ